MTTQSDSSPATSENLQEVITASPLDVTDTESCHTNLLTITAGLLTTDETGRIVFANPSIEPLLGYKPTDIIGKSLRTLLPAHHQNGDTPSSFVPADKHIINEDRTELPIPTSDASDHHVSLQFQKHTYKDRCFFVGTPHGRVCQHDNERGREQQFHDLVAQIEEYAIFRLNPDGYVETWNEGAASLKGYRSDEIIDTHFSIFYPDDDVDANVPRHALEAAERQGTFTDEGWRVRKDGTRFWADVTITALRNDDGSLRGFAKITRDLTEEKTSKQERQVLHDVSRTLITAETVTDGLHSTLETLCESTEWSYGEAWRPNDESDHLEYVTSYATTDAIDSFATASETRTFSPQEGLPGRVWASGTPEWIRDISTASSTRYLRADRAEKADINTALGVPIMGDEHVEAVLIFYFTEGQTINERLQELVTNVAANLGNLIARKQAEAGLKDERAFLNQLIAAAPVGLGVVNQDGTVTHVNDRAQQLLGLDESELRGHDYTELPITVYDDRGEIIPEKGWPIKQTFHENTAVSNQKIELERPDGSRRWLSFSTTPIRTSDDDIDRVVTTFKDITPQREREEELRAFRQAVEHAGHSVYITNTDGTIEYANPAFESLTGYSEEEIIGETPRILSSGEHDEAFYEDFWTTILAGDIWQGEVVNERKSGIQYTVNQTVAPITDDRGDITRFVAVNADITEQKKRERTLEQQRNSLKRVQQVIESLRPLNQSLSKASTQEEIKQLTCEQLALSDSYVFAWYGDYDPATEQIIPREWAGVEEGYLDEITMTTDQSATGQGPTGRAVRTGDVQAARNILTDPTFEPWRDAALKRGFQASAAIPVVFGDRLYGVLGVYTGRPNAFDEYERGLLQELGERVGHAMHAAQNKRLLHTDTATELELQATESSSLLATVTERLDCRLTLNTVVPTMNSKCHCYIAFEEASSEDVAAVLSELPLVKSHRIISSKGSTGTVECTVVDSMITTLVDYGATIRSGQGNGGTGSVIAEVASDTDTETIVAGLQAAHADVALVAKRSTNHREGDADVSPVALDDVLTDRQLEALKVAYYGGFFESPRHSSGEELATKLGISSPTFYQHVRKATQKILTHLDDADLFI
ncbi:PAS domain S-box protein [Halomicrococcus sp. NG-SE-24]|uniref:PAS domain S-box protein n=1 Tax=Halomicrococcus sp. NG-SE-24 TaxID=3436928 RepID=UPI003D993018